MKNTFRKALLEHTVTFGAWVQFAHPAVAEISGRLGFDWICVDLEHGTIDIESAAEIFRATESQGTVAVARVPTADGVWIKRVLEAGARGLIVPMVNSAAQAEAIVRQAKYPPRGERGYGYSRANLYGLEFGSYIGEANDDVAIIVQIEHRDGIAAADSILEVDGVDAAFIGPLDLSGSFGKTAQLDCPEMLEALARFRTACAAHGKAAGMHLVHPDRENVGAAIRDGYTMIALGTDAVFLASAARDAIGAARHARDTALAARAAARPS